MASRSTTGQGAGPTAAEVEAAAAGTAGSPAAGDAANVQQAEAETAATEAAGAHGTLHVDSVAAAAAALLDTPLVPAAFDPGAGAVHIAERTEGFALRAAGTTADELMREAERRRPRPPVTRDVLPRTDFLVDPDSVPGHRYATVATQLRRDGFTYQPGQRVKLDFRAHSQLVPIGAILAEDWHDLPEFDPDRG